MTTFHSILFCCFVKQLKAVEQMYASSVPAAPPSKLYDQFLHSLQTELKRESCDTVDESHDLSVASEPSTPPPPSSTFGTKTLEEELFHHNPLLRQFCLSLKISNSSTQRR